jgi:hypothetical protein
MQERFVEVATPAGRMEAFVTHPEENAPFPGWVEQNEARQLSAKRAAAVMGFAHAPLSYMGRQSPASLHTGALCSAVMRLTT